jgi:hypothetical protein
MHFKAPPLRLNSVPSPRDAASLTPRSPSGRPDAPARGFHTARPAHHYAKDLIFGATSGRIAEIAKKLQMSTDITLFGHSGARDDPAVYEAYRKAYESHQGTSLHEPGRPWEDFGFASRKVVDRAEMDGENAIHENAHTFFIEYSRAAIKSAQERGGLIAFTLSGWDARTFLVETLAAEVEHETTMPAYLDACPKVPAPRLTNQEMSDFVEGRHTDVPVTFLSAADDLPLSGDKFKALMKETIQLSRSPGNRARLRALLDDAKPRDDSFKEFVRSENTRTEILRSFDFDAPTRQATEALVTYLNSPGTPPPPQPEL